MSSCLVEFIQISEQCEAKLRDADDYMGEVLKVLLGMSGKLPLLAGCFAE